MQTLLELAYKNVWMYFIYLSEEPVVLKEF